jgi:hypothetical protein
MRLRPSAIGCALTGSLLLWASSAWTRDDEAALKERVLKTYPVALRALETHFAKAFGSVTGSEEHWIGKPRHILVAGRFTFASRWPDLAKVTRLATLTTMKDGKTKAPKETAFCFNKENAFMLVKEEGKPEFAIKSLAANKDGQSFVKDQMESWLYSYLHAPFSLGGPSMSSIIADGGSPIQRVSLVRRDDKTYLKIEFDFKKGGNKRLRKLAGSVLVAPEEKWVIHEYEFTDTINVWQGRVEYGQPQDGFPVPKRVVSTRLILGERHPTDIDTYDFNELHFGDVPDSEFQLPAFGLPDVRQSPSGGRIR